MLSVARHRGSRTSASATTSQRPDAPAHAKSYGRPDWQLGHPMAGQSLAVTRRPLPVTSVLAVVHWRGACDRRVRALDSPLASPVVPRLGVFGISDEPQKLSTDALLPCGGHGRVAFEPVDGGPSARPAAVARVRRPAIALTHVDSARGAAPAATGSVLFFDELAP
jgi:hypothetical protein